LPQEEPQSNLISCARFQQQQQKQKQKQKLETQRKGGSGGNEKKLKELEEVTGFKKE